MSLGDTHTATVTATGYSNRRRHADHALSAGPHGVARLKRAAANLVQSHGGCSARQHAGLGGSLRPVERDMVPAVTRITDTHSLREIGHLPILHSPTRCAL